MPRLFCKNNPGRKVCASTFALNKRALYMAGSLIVLLAALIVLQGCSASTDKNMDAASIKGGETRATLSPVHFTGVTARAYRAARDIPEVLDSLHCYCECKKNFGHKSLLTCYVNRHAERCGVCIDEAIMAQKLHKEGKDIVSIRRAVDRAFARK